MLRAFFAEREGMSLVFYFFFYPRLESRSYSNLTPSEFNFAPAFRLVNKIQGKFPALALNFIFIIF
jgi:hypothetical protein